MHINEHEHVTMQDYSQGSVLSYTRTLLECCCHCTLGPLEGSSVTSSTSVQLFECQVPCVIECVFHISQYLIAVKLRMLCAVPILGLNPSPFVIDNILKRLLRFKCFCLLPISLSPLLIKISWNLLHNYSAH